MNGGGICPVCSARQGAYDPAIGLPRCKGEHAHPMYYHVPVTPAQKLSAELDEYPTADRPVSKRNPSWTF